MSLYFFCWTWKTFWQINHHFGWTFLSQKVNILISVKKEVLVQEFRVLPWSVKILYNLYFNSSCILWLHLWNFPQTHTNIKSLYFHDDPKVMRKLLLLNQMLHYFCRHALVDFYKHTIRWQWLKRSVVF